MRRKNRLGQRLANNRLGLTMDLHNIGLLIKNDITDTLLTLIQMTKKYCFTTLSPASGVRVMS